MRYLAFLTIFIAATQTQAAVLYDAASGQFPDHAAWGWTYGSTGGDVKSVVGGSLNVNTMAADAVQAGYSKVSSVALTPAGVQVRFELAINAEDHSAPSADKNGDGLADRSGFSLIAIGSDVRGVELGFWGNEIWAQQDSPMFTHSPASERAFVSTAGFHVYDLLFSGPGYSLKMDGATILSGGRKDYAPFVGFPDPYETPNLIFFGDNTTSAKGAYQLKNLSVDAVPEPGTLAALAIGLAALRRRSIKRN